MTNGRTRIAGLALAASMTVFACAGPSVDSPSATCRTAPAYCPNALLVDDAAEAGLLPQATLAPAPIPVPALPPAVTSFPEVITKVAPLLPLVLPAQDSDHDQPERIAATPKGVPGQDLPGDGPGWTKLRGDQGWRDRDGNMWKKDQLHKDHWDISNPKGEKIREVDFEGNQIWPDGPKNKNKHP